MGLAEALESLEATDPGNGAPTVEAHFHDDEASVQRPYTVCGSWPPIHIDHPLQRLDHINKAQVNECINTGEPHLLISVWDQLVTADVSETTSDAIENTIFALCGERPDVHVPQKSPTAGPNEAPVSYIVGGLTEETNAFLLQQFCFSLPDITFFVHSMGVELPVWVCSLRGYWTPTNLDLIRAGIKASLRDDEVFRALVADCQPNNAALADLSADLAVQKVVDTVDVGLLKMKIDEKTNDYKVNLYMQLPTNDIQEGARVLEYLRKRKYTVLKCGPGTPWKPIPCTGCHGADHVRGLCPFQDMPGWKGTRTNKDIKVTRSLEARAARHNNKDNTRPQRGGGRGGYSARGRGGSRGRPIGRDF